MIDSNIPNSTKTETNPETSHFIKKIIQDYQLAHPGAEIVLRFPPEPNGFLHIGHAKSICLNFGTAQTNNGRCNLRFDDTNPEKESQEFINSIKADIQWLGFSSVRETSFASSRRCPPGFRSCVPHSSDDSSPCHLRQETSQTWRGCPAARWPRRW